MLYTIAVAWRQQRRETSVGTALAFSLYWWWVYCVVQQYERRNNPSMTRVPIHTIYEQ